MINTDTKGKKIIVEMDWFAANDEKDAFVAYDLGNLWNGAACPAFDKETADEIMAITNASNEKERTPEKMVFEDGCYRCYEYDNDDDDYLVLVEEFKAIDIDGKKLYPIGAYSWCWGYKGIA